MTLLTSWSPSIRATPGSNVGAAGSGGRLNTAGGVGTCGNADTGGSACGTIRTAGCAGNTVFCGNMLVAGALNNRTGVTVGFFTGKGGSPAVS